MTPLTAQGFSSLESSSNLEAAPCFMLATNNQHKVEEIQQIIRELCPSLPACTVAKAGDYSLPEPVEDGLSFKENALLKARYYANATGLLCLADDSGLCVDALNGAPGIFSARWAGEHGNDVANRRLLLAQLQEIRPEHRQARFVCAMALVAPDGQEWVQEGYMEGAIATEERGESGFGYDPIFIPTKQPKTNLQTSSQKNLTAAQLSPAEKNAISHRQQAIKLIAPIIIRQITK